MAVGSYIFEGAGRLTGAADLTSAAYGRDYFTNHRLSGGERAMYALSGGGAKMTGFIGSAAGLGRLGGARPHAYRAPVETSYSRVMARNHYDAWQAGKAPIGAQETWITYTADLAGISSSRGAAQRLTLLDDAGSLRVNNYVRVDFRIQDRFSSGFRSPIEIKGGRGFGFRHGGYTQGGARELLMNPDAPIEILRAVPLSPWRR